MDRMEAVWEEPLRRIADNPGEDGGLIIGEIRTEKKTVGYNAALGVVEDLMSSGIVDAAQVVRPLCKMPLP